MTYNAGGLVKKKKTEKLKRSDPPNYPSIAPASKGG
jgi:hypothetical protein